MESYKALDRNKEAGSTHSLLSNGMVPGIIYGKGSEPIKIALEGKVLKKLIDALEDLKKTINKKGIQLDTSEPTSISEKNDDENYNSVKSPIIGTAYLAPEPGAKPFVEVGKKIKKGDTVMIVEAMKTMNHVPSSADGVVKEICVQDGQPVEFGQTIIILE